MTQKTPADSISLRGMRFHVRVGILPHEAVQPQPLEIDLTVWRPVGDGAPLDYRALYDDAAGVVADEPLHLLEDVALAIVGRALRHDGVTRARVAVRKPHVGLPGPLAHAEVVVDRARPARR